MADPLLRAQLTQQFYAQLGVVLLRETNDLPDACLLTARLPFHRVMNSIKLKEIISSGRIDIVSAD